MAVSVPTAAPAPSQASAAVVTTDIPARLDRLRWGRFHTLVVVALGITWILDGLEVTLAGAVAPALKESPQLHFSNSDVGFASSAYLAGAVLGALFFGWLTDRLGRKRLFFITLAVYLLATAATALSWSLASYALFRFLTGAGIGGEYTAINSTIQELVPARYRGWTDLVINGSFWIGAAIGAVSAIVLLDPATIGPDLGWRLTDFFGIAANRVGWYLLPFAAGNFLGPLLLGRLFDTLGRRTMIAFTYGVSGVLLAISGYLFSIGVFDAQSQTIAWMVIFFFASPAASAAYLTVSETFPLEVRALAIALFYAIGTGIGVRARPALFGALIDTGSRNSVFAGYLFGSALMVVAAVVAWRYAIAAERKSLESVPPPLAFVG